MSKYMAAVTIRSMDGAVLCHRVEDDWKISNMPIEEVIKAHMLSFIEEFAEDCLKVGESGKISAALYPIPYIGAAEVLTAIVTRNSDTMSVHNNRWHVTSVKKYMIDVSKGA